MLETTSWTTEFGQAFKNLKDLYHYLGFELSSEHEDVAKEYPVFIPRRLAHKIKLQGPTGVLAKEFLPSGLELDADFQKIGLIDPIGDKEFFVAPQLIHRYQSRALFTPTSICPVHCRYCFRKNELNQKDELFEAEFSKTIDYLSSHTEISEIIFTGGDPLTLSNAKLEKYLKAFAQIPHLKDIRFHTRYPVILPERLDVDFMKLMEWSGNTFRTVSLAIHVNHVDEFDAEIENGIKLLSETRIQLLSQTVLLKNVNDSIDDLLTLINKLIQLKVRPYYLHHPDHVKGGMHFYVPLKEGRNLFRKLRNKLPGWAIPHYVVDLPGGHGKTTAYNPESLDFEGSFISRLGESIPYREPDLFN